MSSTTLRPAGIHCDPVGPGRLGATADTRPDYIAPKLFSWAAGTAADFAMYRRSCASPSDRSFVTRNLCHRTAQGRRALETTLHLQRVLAVALDCRDALELGGRRSEPRFGRLGQQRQRVIEMLDSCLHLAQRHDLSDQLDRQRRLRHAEHQQRHHERSQNQHVTLQVRESVQRDSRCP